ncbi:MAG: alpha/beta fold hydrolase [Acidimicrobiales bacterium]
MARSGRFIEIREMFAPQLRALVAPEVLEAAWVAEAARLGAVTVVGEPAIDEPQAGVTAVRVPVTFERGALNLVVSVSESGWLVGLNLAPVGPTSVAEPWSAPRYSDVEKFDEREVTVGSGSLALPGTLSMPRTSSPGPGVVLLAGSGPCDRDGTIGTCKPLKDLAWGLASLGIASLRFDKVTYAHPREVAANPHFTITDEYLNDAAAAVQVLRDQVNVDAARVFVLGHSLGGSVAPRVASLDPSLAGLVIMAGGTQPLQWAIVRQFQYLASLDPATQAGSQAMIDVLSRQARTVDDRAKLASAQPSDLPFGVASSYWMDLNAYQPALVARTLSRPLLILQGGRDYQATLAEDFAGWKSGLEGKDNVTFQIFDDDNHCFFRGSGPSSPKEYEALQHVDPEVVTVIANWFDDH